MSITEQTDWQRLQAAEAGLHDAARYLTQARTLLEVKSLRRESYERFALESLTQAVTALGYELVKREAAPDALDSFVERVNALALGVRE